MANYGQMSLFETEPNVNVATSTTFIDNMKLPVHRWFKFTAGFSAEWVKSLIKRYGNSNSMVLDPFAGSGTTLVSANEMGIPSIGYEKQYFIRHIASDKLQYKINFNKLQKLYSEILNVQTVNNFNMQEQPKLLQQCYDESTLKTLVSMKNTYTNLCDNTPESEIIWLALTSILRSTSSAGTAQWQYVLPNKHKRNVIEPRQAFLKKINEIVDDINFFNSRNVQQIGNILDHDAREKLEGYENSFDMLITSPPYPNNYDYADATRLEMVFWGDISGWGDLQQKVRYGLVHSCSQQTAAEKLKLSDILSDKALLPIIDEITPVCNELEKIRMEHGGKKTYHTMIAAYYRDLAHVFLSVRPLMKENSIICFVIGDSAPYGVYAPADEWLGKLAISAGFKSWSFEKTRDRNIKWKNRKHRVPLKEGYLWVRG
jgi:DNA modification methylase